MEFVDLKTQYKELEPLIQARITNVLGHGQYILGPEVKELENRLADYTGASYCITVSSGTEALLISLMALGIRSGDEVITTPFTFVATAEVIALLGATPVFVDIEPDTCNIDARKIETAITKKTKAIIPVSLYGQPADMDEINEIATRNNLTVIEDGAQSFGAEYKGRKSCNLSTIGCTSFFPSKPLGCYGDGGAIFTNDGSIARMARELRVHGQSERYHHRHVGVGGRMDTLQCAVVLVKLDNFESEIERRITAGNSYNKLFDGYVTTVSQRSDRTGIYGQYTVLVDDRDELRVHLQKEGIPCAIHYPMPLHKQPAYSAITIGTDLSISEDIANRCLSLPMHPYLTPAQIESVVRAVKSG